jgi:hypothetical protein
MTSAFLEVKKGSFFMTEPSGNDVGRNGTAGSGSFGSWIL